MLLGIIGHYPGTQSNIIGFKISCINAIFYPRQSCAIQGEYEVVISGGRDWGLQYDIRVDKYDAEGNTERLPSLITGRKDHACGTFTNNDGTLMSIV